MKLVIAAVLGVTSAVHAAPEAVTFDHAVELALEHASDARIAAAEVARADALLKESRSTLLPLLGAQATYQQLEGDRTVSGRETASGESLISEPTVTMPLLDFRKAAAVQRPRDSVAGGRS